MKPSDKTTTSRLPPHPEEETLQKLRSIGKWATLVTILSFMYGDQTVASQLPPDPRQDSWLLMRSPLYTLSVTLLYVAAVTWWGPLYMMNRKPVTGLRNIMMAYNAFQVVFSAWLFYEGGISGWFTTYKFVCQTCDFSNNPLAIRMMHGAYWYYVSKFVDFIDTLFFVLHKKYEHISLLHVSHHALMPVSVWYGVRYQPGGHGTLMGVLNAFVHTVMYTYYLLAAMGPRVRPYLWWKKYLTSLQMIQFTIVFFHALSLAFVECEVPPVLLRWLCGVAVMFFVLFFDFYIKAYRKQGKTQGKSKTDGVQPDFASDVSAGASKDLPGSVKKGFFSVLPKGVCYIRQTSILNAGDPAHH
ncbi:very long chain fatty acid elongase AAEL008004-like [Panulirus ornatus]|uniref:very long chain fatty acid elongase AAEL008004-like n=1 Tax=Panulirus ornatus TaxID=150431 RepID=UPI003A87518D